MCHAYSKLELGDFAENSNKASLYIIDKSPFNKTSGYKNSFLSEFNDFLKSSFLSHEKFFA